MENDEVKTELVVEPLSKMLKTARLEKNITIDHLVSETRISKHVIEQIEAENPKNLPEPVFLKGFLRAYAQTVGLDPAEVIKLYQTEHGIPEEISSENTEQRLVTTGVAYQKKSYKLPVFLVVVFIVILGVVFLNSGSTTDEGAESKVTQDVETVDTTAQKDKKQVVGYKLEIECVEDTTLKISTDGEQVVEYNMMAEEHLGLKANDNFNILINNTCGVTLFLNDKVVDVPGKCGQTVNMQLP